MQKEIDQIMQAYRDAYEGDPWFGRNMKTLLSEISENEMSQKLNGQHSILELLYHMIVWREFAISRLRPEHGKTSDYFGSRDWELLDHQDKSLWEKGLKRLEQTQEKLLEILSELDDKRLTEIVVERDYDIRYLLNGIVQHDIYHIGQIAYIKKMQDA